MDFVRTIVSGKKKRLRERGYDLDLSYITPRIIAMSFPATGFEKLYRNSRDTVAKFLNETHPNDYRIFNLSGLKFDYTKFCENVAEYPWLDHHSPPIDLLFKACYDMHQWLSSGDSHITVINCRAGKGRTGTLICCYLMFCGRFSDPDETLKYYQIKRFVSGGGVTQPSQKRYVYYFSHILKGEVNGPLCKILKKVLLRPAPRISASGCRPYVEVYFEDRLIYTTKESQRDRNLKLVDDWSQVRDHTILINSHLILKGDVLFKLFHWGRLATSKIFRFAINTAFIDDNIYLLNKEDLDPYSFRKSSKVPQDFQVRLVFGEICQCVAVMDLEDRCKFCLETMGISETERWQTVHSIIRLRREEQCNPVVLIFGSQPDDVEAILQTEPLPPQSDEDDEERKSDSNPDPLIPDPPDS